MINVKARKIGMYHNFKWKQQQQQTNNKQNRFTNAKYYANVEFDVLCLSVCLSLSSASLA